MNKEGNVDMLQAALDLLVAGNKDKAQTILEEILRKNPQDANALHFLGVILCQKGNNRDGVSLIARSISIDSTKYGPFFNLGSICLSNGDYNMSISALSSALSLNPSSFEAWHLLSKSYYLNKQKDPAIMAGEKALQLAPQDVSICFSLSLYNTDLDDSKSIQYLERAVLIKPDYYEAWVNLGNLFSKTKLHNNAVEAYQNALALRPEEAQLYISLANSLTDLGEIDKAISACHQAIAINPRLVLAYKTIANLMYSRGYLDDLAPIIGSLTDLVNSDNEDDIDFGDKTLVWNLDKRFAQEIAWRHSVATNQLAISSRSFLISHINKAQDIYYPSLFIEKNLPLFPDRHLQCSGFTFFNHVLPEHDCSLIIQSFGRKEISSVDLLSLLKDLSVFPNILEIVQLSTGYPHLIWDVNLTSKAPNDDNISDSWHYDNHYNQWTPKVLVYLNSQIDMNGATDFLSSAESHKLSKLTGYAGLVSQRLYFKQILHNCVDLCELDKRTIELKSTRFSPPTPGSAALFYPSRVLHRGVPPSLGIRYLLSFSLTPLPTYTQMTPSSCSELSLKLLEQQMKANPSNVDVPPFWITKKI